LSPTSSAGPCLPTSTFDGCGGLTWCSRSIRSITSSISTAAGARYQPATGHSAPSSSADESGIQSHDPVLARGLVVHVDPGLRQGGQHGSFLIPGPW